MLEWQKDIREKMGKIQIKSGTELTVIVNINVLVLTNVHWLYKMLTLEKAGTRPYRNSLYYLYSFSIKLKLF